MIIFIMANSLIGKIFKYWTWAYFLGERVGQLQVFLLFRISLALKLELLQLS